MGGSSVLELTDVHIVLDAPSSIIDGDEFYDAVDEESMLMNGEILSESVHHLVDVLAEELEMDEFGPGEDDEEIEEVLGSTSEGTYGSRLLEYLLSSVVSGLTLNIVNLTVSLHGTSLSIPVLTISQGFESFIYKLEIAKGLAIKSNSVGKPLFVTEELVDMEVVLEELDGSPPCWSLRIFDPLFTITSQIIEEIKYFHRAFKLPSSSTTSSVEYSMLGSIKLFGPRLEFIDKSMKSRTITSQVISVNLTGGKDFVLQLSGFELSSAKGTLLAFSDLTLRHEKVEGIRKSRVEISPLKVGSLEFDDMKMFEEFFDNDLAKSIQYKRPTWSITISIPSIELDPTMGCNAIFSQLDLSDIEASIGPLQMHCHLSSGILKTSSFDLQLLKASVYRTYKTISRPLGVARNHFDPVYSLVEDQEFIKVLRDPEDYFLLRSGVIDDSENHYHVSIDSMDLLIRTFQEYTPAIRSYQGEKSRCITCSVIKCNLEVEPMNISIRGSSIDGLYDSRFCDIRMDLTGVEWNGFEVQRQVLNPSLDPHFKTFVLTCSLDESMTVSALLSGSLLRIPIEELLSRRAQSQDSEHKLPFDSVMGRWFLNMELCSFQPVLPLPHHRRCPPHVLYAQSFRAVHLKSSNLLKAFLSSGEVFLAPSVSFLAEATGLFAEGHNYWEEQNFECVGGIDFLPITLDLDPSLPQLRIETNTMEFDLYKDSLFTLKKLSDVYLAFFNERATLIQPQQGADSQENENEDVFYGLFGTMDPTENYDSKDPLETLKISHLNVDESEEENILYGSAFSYTSPLRAELESMEEMVKDSDHYLRALEERKDSWSSAWEIEIPDEVIKSDEFTITTATNLDESGEESGLDVDENFFKLGDSFETRSTHDCEGPRFPFMSSKGQGLKARLQIIKATVVLRLHEGRHWTPDKNTRVSSRSKMYIVNSESPTSSSHSTSRSNRGRISVAASSTRWSQPSALATASSSRSGQQPHDYVEVRLEHINSELDWTNPYPAPHKDVALLNAMRMAIDNIQVLDHVRNSRWKTFATRRLTNRFDINRNKPLLKISTEVFFVPYVTRPVSTLEEQLETTLKIDLQPLRFHIDQDTLVFILQFMESVEAATKKKLEISSINLKVDYKPKKIDLRNMFLGQYLELLNLFELEDAEVVLPPTNLRGISSGEQLITSLMHSWIPHVRDTQVGNVVGGVPPVRTAVNLGSGVADLFILPIKCYKRDGQVMRGLRQGVASFLYSTALEGARIGKRLASGAQTLLEHADDVFSPNPFHSPHDHTLSNYSEPPVNVVEGLLEGKETIESSLKSAAQTIIAVPMEVYERVGPGGALKEVLRAVPVALIRPMIGTSAAISRTLLGVESTLDPIRGAEIKQKYKTAHDQHAAYLATSAVSTDSIPEESVFEEFYHKKNNFID